MPLNPNTSQPVTPDRLLRVVAADLRAWPRIADYEVRLCEDAEAALGLLCEDTAGGRVLVRWAGDQSFGGAVREGDISVNRLSVTITRSRSLAPDPGDTETGGGAPYLAALAALRARILSYRISGDATEGFFRYGGTSPVSLPDGLPMAAYEMTYTFKTAMPVDSRYPVALAL